MFSLQEGYLSVFPLLDVELKCIPTLIKARIGQSLSIASYAVSLDPANATYILSDFDNNRKLLKLLMALSDEDILRKILPAAHQVRRQCSPLLTSCFGSALALHMCVFKGHMEMFQSSVMILTPRKCRLTLVTYIWVSESSPSMKYNPISRVICYCYTVSICQPCGIMMNK